MSVKVKFLKDLYSLDDNSATVGLTLGKVYLVRYCGSDGTVAVIDDGGEHSELYRGEYEVVEEEDIHL